MKQDPALLEKKALMNKLLKIEGSLFLFGGAFFLLKKQFTDWTLIDAQIDFYLGLAVFVVGIVNMVIADKFFPTGKQYE